MKGVLLHFQRRRIGYLHLKSLGERELYDRSKMPKLFTEAHDPTKDTMEAHLHELDKVVFPK
jgi:hypothetical protein